MNAPELDDAAVVRTYCEAWMAGDAATVLSLYHSDLTLIWPGRHGLAGSHVGRDAALEALVALQVATNREPIEIVDVLDGTSCVAAIVVERWQRQDSKGESETLQHRRVLEFAVAEGLLIRCQIYESAQAEVDDWLRL